MTKDSYYDMCEQLGTEVIPENIPIGYDELYIQTQQALSMFDYCSDRWDTMNGSYLGKDYNNIECLFGLLGIDKYNKLLVLDILNYIVNYKVKSINTSIKNKAKVTKK